MLSRFNELKRQFSLSDSKHNKDREEVVKQLFDLLIKPPSFRGYIADINAILEEHSMTQKDYLKLILLCFSHQSRTEEEAILIFGYLFYMKVFASMINKMNPAYMNETLQYIALNLEYEKVESNAVLMRFGDKGRKAYIILDGLVDILIKTSKRMLIKEDDYFKYLATLLRYKEYWLLNQVLNDNYSLYPVILKDLNEEMTSLISQNRKCSESPIRPLDISINDLYCLINYDPNIDSKLLEKGLNNVSCEEYIERLNIVKDYQMGKEMTKKGKKLIELNMYSYVIIASKGTGALFGQLALSNPLALRTATIISRTQTHLAILCKGTYKLSLAAGEERKRRNSILFILSTKLFQQVSYDFMDRKFFNNFTNKKIDKGTLLIEENFRPKRVCLLKEGVYEVTIKNSLKYLVSLLKYFTDKLKDNQTESTIVSNNEKEYEVRCTNDKSFNKHYNEKRLFKINFLQCPEVIGLRDYTNKEGLYAFTVECKSQRGEIYEMTTDFYIDICQKDWSIKPNEREFLQTKYALITYHLKTIIYSVIRSFKSFDDDYTSNKTNYPNKSDIVVNASPSKRIMRNTLIDIRSEDPIGLITKDSHQWKRQLSFVKLEKPIIRKSNTFNIVFAPQKSQAKKESKANIIRETAMIEPYCNKPIQMSNRNKKTISKLDKGMQREIQRLKEKFDEYHTYYFSSTNTSEVSNKKRVQKINLNKILIKEKTKKVIKEPFDNNFNTDHIKIFNKPLPSLTKKKTSIKRNH